MFFLKNLANTKRNYYVRIRSKYVLVNLIINTFTNLLKVIVFFVVTYVLILKLVLFRSR